MDVINLLKLIIKTIDKSRNELKMMREESREYHEASLKRMNVMIQQQGNGYSTMHGDPL